MKTAPTFTATIWVGSKVRETQQVFDLEHVRRVCHEHCDEVGLCVTVTPTEYIYTNGRSGGGEPGAAVGLINYPRFPKSPEEIRDQAIELAGRLMIELRQLKVSVVFPDETVMLEADE
jgi:hypothetical protein